jgi:Leucine-rich repeat (LRR) protein
MNIPMVPVESSNIEAVGYDSESQTLRVTFNNQKSYDYLGVSEKLHLGLLDSKSKGSYFHTHIRPHHRCQKVEQAE